MHVNCLRNTTVCLGSYTLYTGLPSGVLVPLYMYLLVHSENWKCYFLTDLEKKLKYENLIGIRMRMEMRLGMGMINTWSARGRRLNTLWGRLRTFCAGLRSSHHLGPFLQWKRCICFHSPHVPFISLFSYFSFLLCPFLSLLAAFQILPTFTERVTCHDRLDW